MLGGLAEAHVFGGSAEANLGGSAEADSRADTIGGAVPGGMSKRAGPPEPRIVIHAGSGCLIVSTLQTSSIQDGSNHLESV